MKHIFKRSMALLLILCMLMSVLPLGAFAAPGGDGTAFGDEQSAANHTLYYGDQSMEVTFDAPFTVPEAEGVAASGNRDHQRCACSRLAVGFHRSGRRRHYRQ